MHIGQLTELDLFRGLGNEAVQALLLSGHVRQVARNQLILHEGESAQSVYLLTQGRVRIFVSNDDGREVTLRILERGELIGEVALFDGGTHSASVVALDACEVWVVPHSALLAFLQEYPEKMLPLLRTLAQRIRRLTGFTRSIALLDVYGRIVNVLRDLSQVEGGQRVIREKPTHQQIALLVGASREMVSRIMKDLSDGGYVRTDDGAMFISDKLPPGW